MLWHVYHWPSFSCLLTFFAIRIWTMRCTYLNSILSEFCQLHIPMKPEWDTDCHHYLQSYPSPYWFISITVFHRPTDLSNRHWWLCFGSWKPKIRVSAGVNSRDDPFLSCRFPSLYLPWHKREKLLDTNPIHKGLIVMAQLLPRGFLLYTTILGFSFEQ